MEELMMEEWTEEEKHVEEESSSDDTTSDFSQDDSDSILEDGSEDASQDVSEDGEESSSTDGAEESVEEGDTEESSSVDVGELVELLKNYTDDTTEESLKEEADADTATPEAPTAVTDEATVEMLTEIHSVLNDMSISMNSIYADTAAYQTQSLEYAQKSEIWLSGIFIALVVVGIGVCINAGLKMADIFFGRMRT